MSLDTRNSISVSTGIVVKKVEEQLISAIAACEEDVRRGAEDLVRLKEALRSLRRQKLGQPDIRHRHGAAASREMNDASPKNLATREREGSAASVIRSFVRKELRQAGRPLTRADILEGLTRAGIQIDAKVPIKRIAKVMWSSAEFVNVGDGYWFAGEPIPGSTGEE